jgi:hypothetical protein
MFHPTDISNLLTEIGYLLSFANQIDTLDLLVLVGYSS